MYLTSVDTLRKIPETQKETPRLNVPYTSSLSRRMEKVKTCEGSTRAKFKRGSSRKLQFTATAFEQIGLGEL